MLQAHKILHAQLEKTMLEYFGESKDISHLKQIKYGNDHEEEALIQFSEAEGYEVLPVGIVVPDKLWFIGVSPDGFIWKESRPGFGIVEVKCLESHQEEDEIEFVTELCENDTKLKDTVNWYTQIQLTAWATKADYAILFLWARKDVFKAIEVELKPEWA